MKSYLLLPIALLFLFTGSAAAQDRIYTIKGAMIEAKVISANAFRVKYERNTGEATETRMISSNTVERIEYEDGHVRVYERSVAHANREEQKQIRARTPFRRRMCPNVLTMNTPKLIVFGEFPGVSIGGAYERFIDRDGKFSASFSVERYWGGTWASGELRSGEFRANLQGVLTTPGIMYHPLGNKGWVDIGMGLTFPIGGVTRRDVRGTNSGYYVEHLPITNSTLVASLAKLQFTMHTKSSFVYGFNLAGGYIISAGETEGAMAQFGFFLGGRF